MTVASGVATHSSTLPLPLSMISKYACSLGILILIVINLPTVFGQDNQLKNLDINKIIPSDSLLSQTTDEGLTLAIPPGVFVNQTMNEGLTLEIPPDAFRNQITDKGLKVIIPSLDSEPTTPEVPPAVRIWGAWEEAYNLREVPYNGLVARTYSCMTGEPYCPWKVNGGVLRFRVSIDSETPIVRVDCLVDGKNAIKYSDQNLVCDKQLGRPALNLGLNYVLIDDVKWYGEGAHTFRITVTDDNGHGSWAEWKWHAAPHDAVGDPNSVPFDD